MAGFMANRYRTEGALMITYGTEYHAYIGTTATHDPHTSNEHYYPEHGTGYWEGERENVGIDTWQDCDFSDWDAIARAQEIARETGNTCVLVVRDAMPFDESVWRVTRETVNDGNRTTLDDGTTYAYRRDATGPLIAFLVFRDGATMPID